MASSRDVATSPLRRDISESRSSPGLVPREDVERWHAEHPGTITIGGREPRIPQQASEAAPGAQADPGGTSGGAALRGDSGGDRGGDKGTASPGGRGGLDGAAAAGAHAADPRGKPGCSAAEARTRVSLSRATVGRLATSAIPTLPRRKGTRVTTIRGDTASSVGAMPLPLGASHAIRTCTPPSSKTFAAAAPARVARAAARVQRPSAEGRRSPSLGAAVARALPLLEAGAAARSMARVVISSACAGASAGAAGAAALAAVEGAAARTPSASPSATSVTAVIVPRRAAARER
mmetsp:Transcript_5344/g.15856  ORF Transcript_5344/g.15856 Transcript_5344/m.15856 type:complete len:292 (-) Transcript_5344:897-1772(-)